MGPADAASDARGDGVSAGEDDRLLDLVDAARDARPVLGEIDPMLRGAARRTWARRMVNEHGSAVVFEGLARQLHRAGDDARAEECLRMACEERRHGVLCGAVVEALGGEARAPAKVQAGFPEHSDVPALEGALRNAVSACCLAETVAVAIISAEREEMQPGDLRRLLGVILADEVGHARFGWRLLHDVAPSLDDAARRRLALYLRAAFAVLERHELEGMPLGIEFGPKAAPLGLCSAREARELFYTTVREVVLPRLEAYGIDARRAWEARAA
jgi:hypothetical protein